MKRQAEGLALLGMELRAGHVVLGDSAVTGPP